MELFIIIISVAAGMFVLYTILGTYIGFKMAIVRRSEKKKREKEENRELLYDPDYDNKLAEMKAEGLEWLSERQYEKHTLKTFDGLTLRGKFYRAENARATVILVHGYRSWSERDFGTVMKYFGDNGFNIFMYGNRAHGESDGKYITFGVLDRYDLRDWTYYVDDLCGNSLPILWDGISMGGATVCMASALELPKNLRAIISDCPFTTPKEEICHTMKHYYHIPAFPLIYTLDIAARAAAKFGLSECDSRKEVSKTKLPLFIAHGQADDFVPHYMGEEIFNACSSAKEFLSVPGAIHGFSYIVATEEYQKKLMAFLERNGFFN
jgi:fermentation-respiration switch protein FrsA (DUF1100 family)